MKKKTWRNIHKYAFGYYKLVSLFISVLMLIICLTGILYNHHHDLDFLRSWRVPTVVLPDGYQERLDRTRAAQGMTELFPEEASSVPIMWLVIDLHNGVFFGETFGRFFYDAIALSLAVLSLSGIVLYFQIRSKHRF